MDGKQETDMEPLRKIKKYGAHVFRDIIKKNRQNQLGKWRIRKYIIIKHK